MAVIYLRSTDGSDADNGSTWALAKATLAGAYAAMAAGDTCYVSQAHAESQASAMTLTSPGTAAAPCRVLCGNDAAEPPTTLATTAVIKTTGSFALTITGFAYFYGITFRAAEGGASTNMLLGVSGANLSAIFDNCRLEAMASTYSRVMINISYSANTVILNNTVVKFGSVGGYISAAATTFIWRGGSLDISTAIPTFLFTLGRGSLVYLFGVDLSGLNTRLVSPGTSSAQLIRMANCRTHASLVLLYSAITSGPDSTDVLSDISDSGDTNYKIDHRKYEGSIVTETIIIRTGGANDGTTGYSWKMVSLAVPQFWAPLQSPPIAIWNEAVGSAKTLTVEIVHDSLTNLKDDEVWVEVDYLGTTGVPLSLLATDRMTDIMAAAADQAASTEAWTTTGLTNPNKQKLVATFTPQEKGPFVARVMLAKASYTVYVCPKVTVA